MFIRIQDQAIILARDEHGDRRIFGYGAKSPFTFQQFLFRLFVGGDIQHTGKYGWLPFEINGRRTDDDPNTVAVMPLKFNLESLNSFVFRQERYSFGIDMGAGIEIPGFPADQFSHFHTE